jgi:hypothetical protein
LSDLSYPSPIWVAEHAKVVGLLLVVLGLVVIVAGFLANAFLLGAVVGGIEIIVGFWIIGIKHERKSDA